MLGKRLQVGVLLRRKGPLESRISLATDELAQLDRELARILMLLDRDLALSETVKLLTGEFGFHAAWIAEKTEQGALIRHTCGTSPLAQGLVLRSGWGLGGKVFARGAVEWVDDYATSQAITHHYDEAVGRENIQSMIAAPIHGSREPIGVLLAGSRDAMSFGNRAAAFVHSVAERTAQALDVAEGARRAAQIAVQEERQRMALDLHDSVGAMLFAISAGIRSASEQPNVDPKLHDRLCAIEQQAGDAVATLRESLRALRTPQDQLTLSAALHAACRAFEERSGVNARLVMLDVLPALADASVKTLIAAAKEGLLNVEKHAGASNVIVSTACIRDGVAVTVNDDGAGSPPDTEKRVGFGLEAISAALAQVGGHLQLSEESEGGWSFRAWVPR